MNIHPLVMNSSLQRVFSRSRAVSPVVSERNKENRAGKYELGTYGIVQGRQCPKTGDTSG